MSVLKPNGTANCLCIQMNITVWFCMGCSQRYAVTVNELYPIRRIDKCLENVGDAARFSILETNRIHREVEIAKRYRNKTAFALCYEVFKFIRMAPGMRNASGTFQCAMDAILSSVNLQLHWYTWTILWWFPRIGRHKSNKEERPWSYFRMML